MKSAIATIAPIRNCTQEPDCKCITCDLRRLTEAQSKRLQDQAQQIAALAKDYDEAENSRDFWIKEHGIMRDMYNEVKDDRDHWRAEAQRR